jgi:FHA domain
VVFDRLMRSLRGKGRAAAAAKKAELRGDLPKAVELFVEAEELGEAARVMLLRGDAETDPRLRLQHYTQAAATAPEAHASRREARQKRAELVIAMVGDAAISAVARQDVLAAAADLEAIGEEEKAARAYAMAGDTEGEARALVGAGDVEGLEDLLTAEQSKVRDERRRKDASADVDLLASSGRRREALAAAEEHARLRLDDLAVRERAQQLSGRRAAGPLARITVNDRALALALGDEIVVGRTEGALRVPSSAVSRRHVRIARGAAGIFVEDLGSRNGTQLHGMQIAGKMPLGDGLELKLGKEVPLRITLSAELPGALSIDLAGSVWLATLGPARLGIGDWRLELGADGWIELVSGNPAAYLRDVALVARTTLLTGDAIGETRGGPAVLRVLG